MKQKLLIPLLVLIASLVVGLLLCHAGTFCGIISPSLELWMKYDEVAEKFPHKKTLLVKNPTFEDYNMNAEERKGLPAYGLNIERDYGLVLGFNENLELVLINRVTRVRINNPSGDVPVMIDDGGPRDCPK